MHLPAYAVRKGVFSWTDSTERSGVRTKNLLNFFKSENQKIRDEMVGRIYQDWKVDGQIPRERLSAKESTV